MSRTLRISNELYERLDADARTRGFANVEGMLEAQTSDAFDLQQRQAAVRRIDGLRKRLFATYGEIPNSTDSIRDDRTR